MTEGLDPASASAAVFCGVLIGIVPIYGLQTLAAIGVAQVFRLNKPLTLAATFVNNPLLQPFSVIASVELGGWMRTGSIHAVRWTAMNAALLKDQLFSWVLGSLLLGVLAGGVAALLAAAVAAWLKPARRVLRERIRFVNRFFGNCAGYDRGFVRWKMRLDRIFSLLAEEDLGTGTAVDLGCGYGLALCFVAYRQAARRLAGCDLSTHRIAAARQALNHFDAQLEVQDVRAFTLPPADLILILDVLQYLAAEDQLALLRRCCAALEPGGRLIFRVHDRERGLHTLLTLGLDRLLFTAGRVAAGPTILAADQYRQVLLGAGMHVESKRFRNRLPLAHILFLARRPTPHPAEGPK